MSSISPGRATSGPGLVANAWLEGTYTEVYPHIEQNEDGMRRLFKQFSFPGGIPSHVAPETPGSIHEGGDFIGDRAANLVCAILTSDNSGIPDAISILHLRQTAP